MASYEQQGSPSHISLFLFFWKKKEISVSFAEIIRTYLLTFFFHLFVSSSPILLEKLARIRIAAPRTRCFLVLAAPMGGRLVLPICSSLTSRRHTAHRDSPDRRLLLFRTAGGATSTSAAPPAPHRTAPERRRAFFLGEDESEARGTCHDCAPLRSGPGRIGASPQAQPPPSLPVEYSGGKLLSLLQRGVGSSSASLHYLPKAFKSSIAHSFIHCGCGLMRIASKQNCPGLRSS
jgi:hypothetical protein